LERGADPPSPSNPLRRQGRRAQPDFYEWKKTATGKQPYAIGLAGSGLMALGGLWQTWSSPPSERIRSFTIVTTTPSELCTGLDHACRSC
jgi:hypothetical protein